MTDRHSAVPAPVHSLAGYRQPPTRHSVRRHIVIMQSAAACVPMVGELQEPLVLNSENPDFAQRLDQVLASATVGSQLYIMGDEAFIWRIHGLARNAGLEDDEIHITHSIAGQRQVYCVHCGLIQTSAAHAQLSCGGCGVGLHVREHFSPRLGAYIGVCADPDQPYTGARP